MAVDRISEKIFFGNVRNVLESLLRVHNIQEINNLGKIEISHSIHSFAVQAVDNTTDDLRERICDDFIYADNNLIPRKVELSEATDISKILNDRSGFKIGFADFFRQRLFSKPVPLLFHTHPTLNREMLQENGFSGHDFGAGTQFGIEQTMKFFNLSAGFFSQGDMQGLENNSRYIRSAMLATKEGIIWVINKDYKLPLFKSPIAKAAIDYGKRMRELLTEYGWLINDRSDNPSDKERILDQGHAAVAEFCRKNGMVAFANMDYKDPNLVRIV